MLKDPLETLVGYEKQQHHKLYRIRDIQQLYAQSRAFLNEGRNDAQIKETLCDLIIAVSSYQALVADEKVNFQYLCNHEEDAKVPSLQSMDKDMQTYEEAHAQYAAKPCTEAANTMCEALRSIGNAAYHQWIMLK